ncbi:unnamed protein product [Prorocentrum cordatum]|uniref:Uncharacterized protein n=1 Tax=Prorocentrum cordatum TaxID=2364126 RepID=A0ABN9PLK6_9DINO|nr:unnamed protein product [Polarella glacialis]
MEKSTTGRGINETHMTWPPVESQERGRETGALPRTSAIKGARPPPARWRIHPPTHLGTTLQEAAGVFCPHGRRLPRSPPGERRLRPWRGPPLDEQAPPRGRRRTRQGGAAEADGSKGEGQGTGGGGGGGGGGEDRQGIERESPGKTMLRLPGAWLVRSRSPAKSWQNKQLGQQRVDEPTAILHKQANTFASKHSSWSTTELQWRAGHEASPNG